MRHGMIPIVMDNMVIDEPKEYFYQFNDFSLLQIENTLEKILCLKADDYIKLSENVYDYANERYSLERYAKDFRCIVDNIVGNEI